MSQGSFTSTTTRVYCFYAIPRPVICIIVPLILIVVFASRSWSIGRTKGDRILTLLQRAWSLLHIRNACISGHHSPSIVPMQPIPSPPFSFIRPPLLHPVGAGWPAPYGPLLIVSTGLPTSLAALTDATWNTRLYF
jgi:hypothetical protein